MATIANICNANVDLRMRRAVYGVALSLVAMVVMSKLGAPTYAYAFLFLPFFMSINLAYQGLSKTCMFMAAKGMRDLGDGQEKVANPVELIELKARARNLFVWSAATALVVTALAVFAATL